MNTFKPVTHRGITYFAQQSPAGWTVQTAKADSQVKGAIRRYKSFDAMKGVIPAFRANQLLIDGVTH